MGREMQDGVDYRCTGARTALCEPVSCKKFAQFHRYQTALNICTSQKVTLLPTIKVNQVATGVAILTD
jgi:hypothetical protein